MQTDATLPGNTDTRPGFGYVRVSTKAQEVARQEETIPTRHKALPDGLNANELILFDDHGRSAWSGKSRPGYEEMYERIKAGEASFLIIDTSSRLTRQGVRQALGIFFELQDVSTRLFTTQGREYTFDLGGLISLIVDAEADEKYSSNLSHNIKTGKATQAKAGRPYHGSHPPGYRQEGARSNAKLIHDGDLLHIAAAFDRYLEGQTYSRICKFLEENLSDEYFQRSRSKKRVVRPDHLRRWLSNPIYVGMIRHKGELIPADHRKAVTQETFDRAQRRLARLAAEFVKPARKWPFSGIAKCALCGHGMRLHPVRNRHGQHFFYVRCNAPSSTVCEGRSNSIIASAFEVNLVLTLASVACATADLLALQPHWGISEQDGQQTMVEARAVLEDADEHLAEMTELVKARAMKTSDPSFQQAKEARDAAELDLERVARRRSSYREELAEMAARIEALAMFRPHHPAFERMRKDEVIVTHIETGRVMSDHAVEDILEGWLAAPFEAKRDVVVATLEKALVSRDGAELHFSRGLPGPVALRLAVEPRRGPALHALEAVGWGEVDPGVGMVRRPLLRRSDSANLEIAQREISNAIRVAMKDIHHTLAAMDFAKAA